VHHGWDIFAKRWTPTRALSDWVVVRIVRDFNWNKFDNILWRNLNIQDKAKNLDIYRWNQVWIKTADGNVTIYAHLENIPENLKEWQFVNMWEYFWQIGRSWVPDKEYTDFHLHFEVQLNPHNRQNNSPLDIMLWQYYWKWKWYSDIISWQAKLFAAWVSSLK
jgi:murein DD-endopeptidase MepM/ murein hydrolase activator NlpD